MIRRPSLCIRYARGPGALARRTSTSPSIHSGGTVARINRTSCALSLCCGPSSILSARIFIRVSSLTVLIRQRACTMSCPVDFSNCQHFHGFMKADLRISIKDYRRNKTPRETEAERGCVVLDQPQHIARPSVIRFVPAASRCQAAATGLRHSRAPAAESRCAPSAFN